MYYGAVRCYRSSCGNGHWIGDTSGRNVVGVSNGLLNMDTRKSQKVVGSQGFHLLSRVKSPPASRQGLAGRAY